MSEEQENEEVELTESDLAVIDEINEERSAEAEIEDIDDISVETEQETSQDIDNESVEVSTPEPTINDELRQAAQYYGLNPQDFSSEGSLKNVIDQFILAERQVYNAQQYSNQQNAQQTQQRIVDQFRVGLGDDYDEGLRDAINSLAGNIVNNFNGQLGTLQDQISYQQQFVDQAYREQSQQMAQGQLDQFNDAVASLKHKSLFGDKSFQDIDPNSTEGQNMAQLFDQMTVLATGYQQMGQQPPGYKQLVEQAYRALYGNEIDSLNKRRTNDRLRKQAKRRLGGGATTSKPIAMMTDDPVNDPSLKEAFDGYLRENGDI